MMSPKKVVNFQFSSMFQVFFLSLFLILGVWFVFILITSYLRFPFPDVKIETFFELSFLSISLFNLFIFLTIMPFQVTADRLSPVFYHKIYNTPSAHFGVSLLSISTVISFLVVALHQAIDIHYLSQLFVALIASTIFAIVFHRFWVLHCLYQPYLAYKYVETLDEVESLEEAWVELYECTAKAIKQNRISDVNIFIGLMKYVYNKCSKSNRVLCLQKEDILSLYEISKEQRPLRRFIEERWPFTIEEKIEESVL